MKIKKKILIPVIAAALAAVGTGVWIYNAENPPYNTHPDLSNKAIGSLGLTATRMPFTRMDRLVGGADLIIIGTVLDNGVENIERHPEMEKDSKDPPGSYDVMGTLMKVHINQLIAGEAPESRMITLWLLGKPETMQGMAKPVKGQKLYFFLHTSSNNSTDFYYSVGRENGLFYVKANNTLISMGGDRICARYDGLPVSRLTNDVKKTKKYREVLGKKTGWIKNGAPAPVSSAVSGKPAQSSKASSGATTSKVASSTSKPRVSSGASSAASSKTSSKASSGASSGAPASSAASSEAQ